MIKLFEKITGLCFAKHDFHTYVKDANGEIFGGAFRTHLGRKYGLLPHWSYVQKCRKCGYVRDIWLDKLITFLSHRKKPITNINTED